MKIKISRTYVRYTICFLVVVGILSVYLLIQGKSPIWAESDKDGLTQHYSALAYWGRYLREFVQSLFQGKGLCLPEWNFSIGYGADVFSTFHYYAIGDPLNLLAVFCPYEKTEALYVLLTVLRLYLAGISFLIYCRYHGRRGVAAVVGALIYVFSSYTLRIGIHYPFFYNVLIYFPLILMGADKILKKQKPYQFVLMLGIAALSSFYFFYMQCIMLIIYVIFQYVRANRPFQVKPLLCMVGKFLGYGIWGTLLGGLLLIPVLYVMVTSQRAAAEHYLPVLYEFGYYIRLIANPLGVNGCGYNNYMGYAATGVLSVFALFVQKKKNRIFRAAVVLLVGFTLIPFVGQVFNGFSYATNRWEWAILFFVSYVTVRMIPAMTSFTPKEKGRLVLYTVLYAVVCISIVEGGSRQINAAAALLCVAAVVAASYGTLYHGIRNYKLAVLVVTFACLAVNIDSMYYYKNANHIKEFIDIGTAYDNMVAEQPVSVLNEGQAKNIRYDTYGTRQNHNSAMMAEKLGTDYYFSLSNGVIGEFFNEMNINFPYEMIYSDLDTRMPLQFLLGAQYFLTPRNAYVPPVYSRKVASKEAGGQMIEVYKTPQELSLGYTYDCYIPREQYEGMSPVQKQQAMMQGAVVEESRLRQCSPVFTEQEIPYTVQCAGNGITYKNGEFRVTNSESSAAVTLSDVPKDAEVYAAVKGIQFQGIDTREIYSDDEWNALPAIDRFRVRQEDLFQYPQASANFFFINSGVRRFIQIRNNKHDYYCGRTNFMTNLGCNTIKGNTLTLKFSKNGIYSFDELKFYAQPLEPVKEYAAERYREKLENVQLGTNTLSGDITVSGDRMLCLSIPYSDGWTVYVDGNRAKIERVNTMMLGTMLSEGSHRVEIVYKNKGLHFGFYISLAAVLALIICVVINRMRKRKG